jgi:hypothetical protein
MKRVSVRGVLAFALLAAVCVVVPQALSRASTPTMHMVVQVADPSLSAPLDDMAAAPAREAGAFEEAFEQAREHEGEGEGESEAGQAGEGGEARPSEGEGGGESEERIKKVDEHAASVNTTEAVQSTMPMPQMPSPVANFDGITNALNPVGPTSIRPPDVNADVGPNDIVETVNQSIAVFDKSGNIRAGYPKANNAIWASFPTGIECQNSNDGDPVVLYDQLSDRWLLSQFALPNFPNGPFFQCIAVTQTGDPTGAWNRYQFTYSNTKLNDYPKFGVWPDGYYASFNQFQFNGVGFNFVGAGAVAYDRTKMIAGQAATAIYFDVGPIDPNAGGLLPSDLNGSAPPPAGSPNYFLEMEASEFGLTDSLRVWEFHADFATPANSTFGMTATLPTAAFNPVLCNFNPCIPQSGTAVKLDTLADRLMYRLNYRKFADHESLVVTHSVKVSATNQAGVRWYEVRDPGGSPVIFQQGTFAPDTLSRWMGSVNQDKFGNIAVGYSTSSSTSFPSIRYAGRLAGDPLGDLTQGEATLVTGGGAQTVSDGRWGDYTSMSVDPTDDCTFWYAGEYMASTSSTGWRTRIGSFSFPGCSGGTPTVSIADKAKAEGAAGTTSTMKFTLTLSAPSANLITVQATTSDGTAVAPGDYTAANRMVQFPAGTTTATFKVRIIGDAAVEPNERFNVDLSSPTNVTIGDGHAVGTIRNDD